MSPPDSNNNNHTTNRTPHPGSTPLEQFQFDPPAPPSFQSKPTHKSSAESENTCPFCNISAFYGPFSTANPPDSDSPRLAPSKLSPHAFVILSTPTLLAFLDIMPLARGHILLCPRAHRSRLSDVTRREAQDLGEHLRLLSRALVRATGVPDWNVVQNNGAAAAQVVDHVHYHLIPRPELRAAGVGRSRRSFTMFGRGSREELDDDEAVELADKLREALAAVVAEEREGEWGALNVTPAGMQRGKL